MWIANMKLYLGQMTFILFLLANAKSEKLLDSVKEQDQGDEEENSNDSITSGVHVANVDMDSSNDNIMRKLKELPSDKLKNILKIINKQNDAETEASSNVAPPLSNADDEAGNVQTLKEGTSVEREERPGKISFHRVSRVGEQPGTLVAGHDFQNGEDKPEPSGVQNMENNLSSSKLNTKTGNLRQLKRLEPVTNVLIHAFEGDMDEGADIGANLRSSSRAEGVSKPSNELETEPVNTDVFADTEDSSIRRKGGQVGSLVLPGSRLKLARLMPRLQNADSRSEDQSSRRKEGTFPDGERTTTKGGSQDDDSSRAPLQLHPIQLTNKDLEYLKPIKLRPLPLQRGPYKNVINEKLPEKIIEEISQAMIDRVNDSGDRKASASQQEPLGHTSDTSNTGTGPNLPDASMKNVTSGETDKRAATKSQFAFSYDPDSPIGPEMWKVLHTDWTCQGRKQSPINIKTENVANDTICKNIVIRVEPDGRPITGILRNNGHAPTFSLVNSASVRLMGATLPNDYFLKQLHFHFGCENSRGSEHKIDDQTFPMELHLVFWDKQTFESFAQAAKSDRGIAVVAVLFQRSFVPVSQARNTPVTQLLQVLKKIPNEGDFVQISDIFDFRLEKLIPNIMNTLQADRFFTYEGSLTTPGCYESVTWIVLNTHPIVTDDQLEMFRKLKSAKVNADGTMCDNYRPIQKSFGRRVYSNIV